MVWPAIGAGAVLVALYVLSDFGAVALLRYPTFTAAIYYQMGGFDADAAAVLSTVLILITVIVLVVESRARRKRRFYQSGGVPGPPPVFELGRLRYVAFGFASVVFAAAAGIPIAVLLYWARVGIAQGVLDAEFVEYVVNTLQVAGMAALAAMVLSLPVVYLRSRHPSWASTIIERLAYSGYALPGVIVAIGLIFFTLRAVPLIYNTMFVLAIAYLIRFMPQNMQSTGASLEQISPRIDDAARIAGLGAFAVMSRVVSRLAAPGVLAGGALVFVSSAKELPATLLLRPVGFDTLSVRVWVEAAESQYYLAAPAALVMVFLAVIPLKLMLDRY
jgi:iron(III) transport system permease protein